MIELPTMLPTEFAPSDPLVVLYAGISRSSGGTAPIISGTGIIGDTLTSNTIGQWFLDGEQISSETGDTLVVPYHASPGQIITQDGSNAIAVALVANPLRGLPFVSKITNPPQDRRTVTGAAGSRITWQTNTRLTNTTTYSNWRMLVMNTSDYFGSPQNGELVGIFNEATVTARASYSLGSADFLPASFGGQPSVQIPAGGYALTDTVAAAISQGNAASGSRVRTEFVTTVTDQQVPLNYAYGSNTITGTVLGTDIVNQASRTITDANDNVRILEPVAFFGTPAVLPVPRFLTHQTSGFGDSIFGYVTTQLIARGVPYFNFGAAGHSMRDYCKRTAYASARRDLLFSLPILVNQRGVNDWQQNSTLAQMKEDFLSIAREARRNGVKRLIAMTLTPLTTSTDGYATPGNQTIRYADWSAYNQWLRDLEGPDVYSLDYHCIDVVPYCADGPLLDKWKAGMTNDGIHPNQSGASATISSGIASAFQAALEGDFS